MKIWSWNVNGIRAACRKGFGEWLDGLDGELVGLQEVRARRAQVPRELHSLKTWPHWEIVCAEKAGYSGVGFFSRRPLEGLETSWEIEEFDREGRYIRCALGKLVVINVYFPNGSGSNRDKSRVPYKLAFTKTLRERLRADLQKGHRILVMGDFNTAHHPIDLARPKGNRKTSGFLVEERAELDAWEAEGWEDTFRVRHPNAEGAYTWWSTRGNVRARNVGWRIDYIFASPGAQPFVRDAFIHPSVMGSDHCPIGVELEDAVCV